MCVDVGETCKVAPGLGVDRLHSVLERFGVRYGRVGLSEGLLQCVQEQREV